jgi:hypothetical protein
MINILSRKAKISSKNRHILGKTFCKIALQRIEMFTQEKKLT